MGNYKLDISVARVGVSTAPAIPFDDPRIRHSSCLYREGFLAESAAVACSYARRVVENPSLPEFQKVLDDYFVPCKSLEWQDWTGPMSSESNGIYSCSSFPFLVGNFWWIVIVLVEED